MPSSGQPPEIMMVSDDNSDTRSILAWVTCLATWVMVKSGPSLLLRAMSGSAVALCVMSHWPVLPWEILGTTCGNTRAVLSQTHTSLALG